MGFKILENAMKWKLAAAAALSGETAALDLPSIAFPLFYPPSIHVPSRLKWSGSLRLSLPFLLYF